ncbi:MAG: aminotransferase class V-fold PLP-dependent enzyme [Candidatus Schekmanbacteria bacterium]|nr:aminotransferase class V-fold PLP-dependent enzyme [Candidatus Schekmanbacteria bacterium]
MTRPVYMDYHATTPVDPRVVEAMMPYFTERFGNAASRSHVFGWEAAEAVEQARDEVAQLIGAAAAEIVFTSGATESNNLAIKGAVAGGARKRRPHVVTCATEHKSVLEVCRRLERHGVADLTVLPVDGTGRLVAEQVGEALRGDTVLVTIMLANNEIGVLQPLAEIGAITRQHGCLLHTDATQAAGRFPVDVDGLGVDLLSLSAHKVYGPKGVGALYVRRRRPRIDLLPLQDGGDQERGVRAGTINVPGVVGFGAACRIAGEELQQEPARLSRLRDRLENGILSGLAGVTVNGHQAHRLPNNSNLSFGGVEGESLLISLPEIALSSGSACSSTTSSPSHVLKAMGLDNDAAIASLRFGLGRWTSVEQVDFAIEKVVAAVTKLRRNSPSWAAMRSVRRGHERLETKELA